MAMTVADYTSHDATGLAELVHSQKVSPLELVDTAIELIEKHNPALNAVIWTMFDRARDTARSASTDGVFAGVPFLLKDILGGMAGVPTRDGSRLNPGVPATHNSELVNRFLKSGLIPLGKTNVPEFGLVGTTESKLYGPARNPWNTMHSTGGSSGGSSAAVASGMVPVAHANDGGGSIRMPASCCGLVGLKPTRARNPLGPDFGDMYGGLIHEHIVSRSVRDSATMLDVTSGADLGDPYFAPSAPPSFLAASQIAPKGLRIAVTRTLLDGRPLHPDCLAAVDAAAALCESLGHHVEEAKPDISTESLIMPFFAVWAGGLVMQVDALIEQHGGSADLDHLEGLTLGLYRMGQQVTAAQYMGALLAFQRSARIVARWQQNYDLWLTPTLGGPPMPIGTMDFDLTDPMAAYAPVLDYSPFTPIQNCGGQPAISLPLHWNNAGLPIGVQFAGRFGDDAGLLAIAAQLEAAAPWSSRRPTIWG
jgi:amidase